MRGYFPRFRRSGNRCACAHCGPRERAGRSARTLTADDRKHGQYRDWISLFWTSIFSSCLATDPPHPEYRGDFSAWPKPTSAWGDKKNKFEFRGNAFARATVSGLDCLQEINPCPIEWIWPRSPAALGESRQANSTHQQCSRSTTKKIIPQ